MLTRRMFLSDTVLALAAAGCSAADQTRSDRSTGAASDAPSTSKGGPGLKLTTARAPGALCLVDWLIAAEQGLFSAEGLDVQFLDQDWTTHNHGHFSAWLKGPAGRVRNDLLVVEYPVLPEMASGAMDYYVVAGEHSGCRQLICPVDSPVRVVADLKGKRIGTWLNEDPLIWEFLVGPARAGGKPMQWIDSPIPLGDFPGQIEWVKQEFAARRIDAYVGPDPLPEFLKADGTARLVASNTWTPPLNSWYCCMVAVRKELVDSNPDLPRRFTRAIRRAAAFVEEKPAEAVALGVEKGYFPPSTHQDLYARLLGEYVWAATGRIQEDLERYFQLLIDAGRIQGSLSPSELVKRVYRSGE